MGTVTVINTTPYKLQPVPDVGKEYHIFDDGKIRPNRHYVIKILEVIPFSEFTDSDMLEVWREEIKECYWLYAQETDYFVKTDYDGDGMVAYFVRTTDGGWFSLGWFGARLDIDGSLYEKLIEYYGKE